MAMEPTGFDRFVVSISRPNAVRDRNQMGNTPSFGTLPLVAHENMRAQRVDVTK